LGCAARDRRSGIGDATVPPPGAGLTDAVEITCWPAIGAAGATDSNVEVATAGNDRVRHPGRGAGASPVGRGHRERVRRAATSLHASATDPSACPAALTDDDTPGALADETTIVVAVDDVKVYELGKHGVPRP
jgi:hypothetical protein